jgi:hypothetical protein
VAATPLIFVSHKLGNVSHNFSGVLAQKNGGKCPHIWCLMVAGEVFLPENPSVVVVTIKEQEGKFRNKKHWKQVDYALIENTCGRCYIVSHTVSHKSWWQAVPTK